MKRRSKNFLPEIREAIYAARADIVERHGECGGTGYVPAAQEGQVYRCVCMILFRYVKELIKARLPKSPYWTLTFDDLKINDTAKMFAETYMENLDRAIANGLGFVLHGPNGTGKTSTMVEIGKEAIVRGYNVRYFTMATLVNAKLGKDTDLVEDLEFGDILLIDEIDKINSKKLAGLIEEFLRRMSNAGKSMILGTNWNEEEIPQMLDSSTLSLLKRNNEFLFMPGDDYSEEIQADFLSRLTTDFDYWNDELVRMAKRMEAHTHV